MEKKEKTVASIKPKYFLSICIPTWNRFSFLKNNVEQILNEITKTHYLIQLVISDNASDDGTKEYCENLATHHDFILYNRNEKNIGANSNFEKVLELSNAEYTWLLGDDDKIVENCLEKIINDIQHYHNPEIIIGACVNHETNMKLYPPFLEKALLSDKTIFKEYDAIRIAGKMSVIIFKKSALTPIIEKANPIIRSLKTPWPHLIWVILLLNESMHVLFLPYGTNYFLEESRYNMLQDGNARINIMVKDYAALIYALYEKNFISDEFLKLLNSSITKNRQIELLKIMGYNTFLNHYYSSLKNAYHVFKFLRGIKAKTNFFFFYFLPLLLPIFIRKLIFNFVGIIFSNKNQFNSYLFYLKKSAKIFNKNKRNIFNSDGL